MSHDDEVTLDGRTSALEVDDNLVEILQTTLAPLYERFSFFELRPELVRTHIDKMRKNRS